MKYHVKKLSAFIKFKRFELSMTQREFAETIFVSRSLVDSIENGKLTSLDHHVHKIFECFHLDENQYCDRDEEIISQFHQIIHQSIYYELPENTETIIEQFYFKGIENTYLYLYYQLLKVCLYSRKYIHDSMIQRYIPIFDVLISLFDDTIQQYYQITKYIYYKEKRLFDLCVLNDENEDFKSMDNDMKSYYYHAFSLRYMYESNLSLEFKYMNLAKEYCTKTNNQRRLIALTIIECDTYEKLGNISKSIELLKCGLDKMRIIRFMNLYDIFLSDIGVSYFWINEYENAIKYLTKSLDYSRDNLDLFYLVLCYMRINDNEKVKELLTYQYKVKCFDEVFYDLLEWCVRSMKRPYTKKCEYLLTKAYKRYYKNASLNTKKILLELLIEHYEYNHDYYRVSIYQKEFLKIFIHMGG